MSIEIYSELSKRQYESIQRGESCLELPYGVSMFNKKGSRGLYFTCDNEDSAEELIEGLEGSLISWEKIDG